MYRKILVSIILFSFVFVGYAYSAEGVDEFRAVRWGQVDTYSQLKRQLPYDFLYLGHPRGTVSTVVTGTTAIPVGYSIIKLVGSGTAKTLANGTAGQILTIICVDYVSAVTVTPATSTGWLSASLGANGQTLILQYVNDTYGWLIVGISGTTITGKNSGS